MTGADVNAIRMALGRVIGRRVSCRDLGLALGLAPANAADTVRRWERDGPTGPAAVALGFMRQATDLMDDFVQPATVEDIERMVRGLFSSRALCLQSAEQ